VIVVALIAGGALVLSRHSDPQQREQAGGIVPWNPVGQRLDTAGVSTARPIGAPAGVRLCSSADFTVVFGRTAIAPDALAGWLTTSFVLRSTAQSPCSVSAYGIDVELVDANGGPLPDDVVRHGPPAFPSMLLVRPGQFVFGAVSWAWYDGRAPRPARLVIDPRGGAADSPLIVSLAGVSIPPHPLNPSNLGLWRSGWFPQPPSVGVPGSLASLSATMHAPPTVANGSTVRYTVEVVNHTTAPVTFDQCPDIVQRLDVVPIKQSYTSGTRGPLNCASAPSTIAAGAGVTFAFELDTKGVVPGRGRLSWQLVLDSFPAVLATAELTVTP